MPESRPYTNQALVDLLREHGDLNDPRVNAAFSAVPREKFLPGFPLDQVYTDQPVTVRADMRGETLCCANMPSMIAHMLSLAQLHEGQNVLHIGTGTGYTAALIQHIIGDDGHITTLEIDRDIANTTADNLVRAGYGAVHVVHKDGAEGYAPRAAYDRIIASVGIWDMPLPWITQLKPNGRIIAPIWIDGLQVCAVFTIQPDGTLYAQEMMPSAYIYIRGLAAGPTMQKMVGSTALKLIGDDLSRVDTAALYMLLSSDQEQCYLSVPLDTASYWYGFLPYVMLNEPENDVFAIYTITQGQKAYGMEGEGFALFTPASAAFVPYYGLGATHCFAGADAFLELETLLASWQQVGKPSIRQLRLRLIPKSQDKPHITRGKLYERHNHYLHAWIEANAEIQADE
ncbi:MAG: hypothetical protein Kow00117_06390 [Phototrophicales bacterium]